VSLQSEPLLHIVLHQPQIAPNTGAIGRTCVALNAKLWLIRPLGFRIDERTLRRAGLDYWKYLNWQVADHWDAFLESIATQRLWFFSRFAKSEYTSASFACGDVLVFGSEADGLPLSLTDKYPGRLLRIPTTTNVRSLNLSAAVAVAAFEAQRQIRYREGPTENC
jgi:tRNA (cytidine/uridine-2'-O-)-methyltransferase